MILSLTNFAYAKEDVVYGEKDINMLIKHPFGHHYGKIGDKRKFYGKRFVFKTKITGYHNDKKYNYAVVWFKKEGDVMVGCLSDADDTVFDNLNIGDEVLVKGKIHHIEIKLGKHILLKRYCNIKVLKKSDNKSIQNMH